MTNQITCPHCQKLFSLSEIANHEKEEWQKAFEAEANKKVLDWQKKKEAELTEKFRDEEGRRAKELEEKLTQEQKKREEAEKNEIELRKKQDELVQREKNIELEKQRAIDAEKEKLLKSLEASEKLAREKLLSDKDDEHRRKELEYQKQLEQMKKSLDDAQRKADQGSMQIQGDIQEDDLRDSLRSEFPIDIIDDVPTGVNGADLIHTVKNNLNQEAGTILWESKNTKTWGADWISKLKKDQQATKANFAILVSITLPKDIENFGLVDGVWVTRPEYILPVTSLIRQQLISLSQVRSSLVGKDTKMEALYAYLSGDEFKMRVTSIVDAFVTMQADLEKEKRAMKKIWGAREKQLEQVIDGTSGMYGDLEGLIGNALPEVEALMLETDE